MGFWADAFRAYGARIRRAFPLLIAASIILDALVITHIEPAPPLVITFWLGVWVAITFLIVTGLYVFWLYLTGAVRSSSSAQGNRTSQ